MYAWPRLQRFYNLKTQCVKYLRILFVFLRGFPQQLLCQVCGEFHVQRIREASVLPGPERERKMEGSHWCSGTEESCGHRHLTW